MTHNIRTRLLIISDTHGMDFTSADRPHQRADVVLHCGDLTDGSKLDEFRVSLQLLKGLDAPLKLCIAGNHDFTMDHAAFQAKVSETTPPLEPELVAREYGLPGEARQMFDEARENGIVFLDEGTHRFTLENGASLTIYASPYTPSLGAWGFQYNPNEGRKFAIDDGTDVVMTHGPPRGILDYTHGRERAGCPDLFAAVARARPRVHCFGHIHEAWGARLVAWKGSALERPTHFTAIDHERSPVIENLASLKDGRFDSEDTKAAKRTRRDQLPALKCAVVHHGAADEHPLRVGEQTIFVNASFIGSEDFLQRPWIVDVDLRKA